MIRALLLAALLGLPQEQASFVALDVFVDTGGPALAAYQFELACEANSKVVGIEGGEPKLFAEAPYYDPAALQGGRIVVAAFTTEPGAPAGRVRVARLMMRETGAADYHPRLTVAARPGGQRIDAKIEIVRPGGKK